VLRIAFHSSMTATRAWAESLGRGQIVQMIDGKR
jgi:hypothetical protein